MIKNEKMINEKINKMTPGLDVLKFLKERYNDYLMIQEAWMNFNYEILRQELTDEIYNEYVM